MRKFWWIALIAIIGIFTISGCGSDDDTVAFTDYKTGTMITLDPVSGDGVKTLQAATADTHEVETDGNWIVWKGRSINVSYYDGTDVYALAPEPGGSVVPWAFNFCDDSPVAFDGGTIVSVANDVASADKPRFYYCVPEDGTGGEIDLPFDGEKDLQDDYLVYVSGDLAVVADEDNHAIYRAFFSDAVPAFTEFEICNEPAGATGVYLAVINEASAPAAVPTAVEPDAEDDEPADGAVIVYDMAHKPDVTFTSLAGDGDPATEPDDFRSANGIFTWREGDIAYYCEPGTSLASTVIYNSEHSQSNPVAGPDYFLWEENDSIWYLAKADVGTAVEPSEVAFDGDLENVETGDGFFAYIDQDVDGYDQIFVYDLSDLSATQGIQVTDNGEGAEEETFDDPLKVDGTKIYDIFEYCNNHGSNGVYNPSRVLVMYDVATEELKELAGDRDFQQVPVYAAAGGKAVFLHRDHSFRLFIKEASVTAKPVTLTPVDLKVSKFSMANGVVAFKALDRSRYLDDPDLYDEYAGNFRNLTEVYYIDLDGAREIVKVTDNTIRERNPQTDGSFITWRGDSDDDYAAYAYEIATGETQNIGTSGDKISVAGGIAVWEDHTTHNVAYLDLNTDAGGVIAGSANPDKCPDIADGLITWEDENRPYYYDLNAETPAIVDIYATVPAGYSYNIDSPVNTDGRFLTWLEYRWDWDHDNDAVTDEIRANVVVVHDTTEETTFDVPAADFAYTYNGTSYRRDSVCYPNISDGIVLFGAVEYGVENPDDDKEIFYCDVTADTPELVRLTNDPEGEGLWDSRPRIADGLVVWRTGGSGSYWDWRGKSVAAAFID